MACIGGILVYVAQGMVKMKEIKEILASSKFHVALMIYTAIMVPVYWFYVGRSISDFDFCSPECMAGKRFAHCSKSRIRQYGYWRKGGDLNHEI